MASPIIPNTFRKSTNSCASVFFTSVGISSALKLQVSINPDLFANLLIVLLILSVILFSILYRIYMASGV